MPVEGFDALLKGLGDLGRVGPTQGQLERAGEELKAIMQAEPGSYQPAVGPYPSWPQLADATQRERAAAGYTPNDPLLRSGAMRDAIDVLDVTQEYVEVGIRATDPTYVYAKVQELGAPAKNIPARPFVGPALFRYQMTFVDMILSHLRSIRP